MRQASPAEKEQFFNEVSRAGWDQPTMAMMDTGYAVSSGRHQSLGLQFATLFGDLDGDKRGEWVVGYYVSSRASGMSGDDGVGKEPVAGGDNRAPEPRDDRFRIAVFKQNPEGDWKAMWRSPGLGYELTSPEYNLNEVAGGLDSIESIRPPLSLVDIDKDGRLEIVFYCRSESRSLGALPGVYRFNGQRWVSIAPQADRFSLRDLDNDGKLEIVAGSREIGTGTGDDDVPRVWRWDGRAYREASADFPKYYAGLVQRYREYVKRMEASGARYNQSAWQRAITKANSLAG
jgi:hypothetical protein